MIRTLAVMFGLAMVVPAQAQQLKIATGSAKGTYTSMFREFASRCSETGLALVPQESTGSVDTLNKIVGNEVNAGFVQTDVLFFRARSEDLSNVKTLIALHPEEVHFIALSAARSEGGHFGIGAKQVVLNTIADLNGRKVGAAGGSFVTVQVVRLQSEIPFNIQQFDTNDAALAALASGQVDAVVMVGGAPLPAVANLDARYKLLSVPEVVVKRLESVYRPARVTYTKMNAQGVPTVATDALFITREYKTAKMTDSLSKLRQCVLSNLDELKETTGTHPKWQAVNGSNKGKWAWYDLPTQTTVKAAKR